MWVPVLGWGRRSRPARKMIRRRKLLGMCARPAGSPQRQVHYPGVLRDALLGSFHFTRHYGVGVCDGIGVRGQPPVIP